MVDEINKTASNVSNTAKQAVDVTQDAARRGADQAKSAVDQTAETVVQLQDGAGAAATDVQKTFSEAYGRSLQELQDLSQRAFAIRSPKDLATWQLDLFQHLQNDARAAIDIYRASVSASMRNILPVARTAPAFQNAA